MKVIIIKWFGQFLNVRSTVVVTCLFLDIFVD